MKKIDLQLLIKISLKLMHRKKKENHSQGTQQLDYLKPLIKRKSQKPPEKRNLVVQKKER